MLTQHKWTFKQNHFEGPLELLLYLIQRKEIDICTVTLKDISAQLIAFLEKELAERLGEGAEMLALTATLLLLKSRTMLPNEPAEIEELDNQLRYEIIPHLLEYCKFKEIASGLSRREKQQEVFHLRQVATEESEMPREKTAISEELTLGQLSSVFQNLLERAATRLPKALPGEEWRVADKILYVEALLAKKSPLSLKTFFNKVRSRIEAVVTFLALLELMKEGRVTLQKTGHAENETSDLEQYTVNRVLKTDG